MRSILLPLVVLWSFTLSAQSYFSSNAAAQKLQSHQTKLSELHLKLLSRERAKGGFESQWKKIYQEALGLEGVLACADSEWYYTQYEPQVYRTQGASVSDPEAFFNELTRLVALTSYKYEAIAAAYERNGCASEGVRQAVHAGRKAHERLRPALKGISEGNR
ncbi:MAG: hypothetical protein ABR83_05800 [Cryomorphaceae bacterium BACL18 MAG-120924-bin36]|jgi:hypothetical protein|nr:MAG: hypothetical protein ABR83_05800 [Cryomorphaceae bacterium BACL18 MAG-120924-bin36]KRP06295.1 MAG: hypothetical protein ABS25_01440 [Cryomorphaceae bacterium BACL18 MAG-120507-bin74]